MLASMRRVVVFSGPPVGAPKEGHKFLPGCSEGLDVGDGPDFTAAYLSGSALKGTSFNH